MSLRTYAVFPAAALASVCAVLSVAYCVKIRGVLCFQDISHHAVDDRLYRICGRRLDVSAFDAAHCALNLGAKACSVLRRVRLTMLTLEPTVLLWRLGRTGRCAWVLAIWSASRKLWRAVYWFHVSIFSLLACFHSSKMTVPFPSTCAKTSLI